jgi:hypothetical protein
MLPPSSRPLPATLPTESAKVRFRLLPPKRKIGYRIAKKGALVLEKTLKKFINKLFSLSQLQAQEMKESLLSRVPLRWFELSALT